VITIYFIGAHAGNRPRDAHYSASAVADRRAVAVTIRTVAAPAPPNTICTTIGYTRTAVLHLNKPLGARVLISATDGGALPVHWRAARRARDRRAALRRRHHQPADSSPVFARSSSG